MCIRGRDTTLFIWFESSASLIVRLAVLPACVLVAGLLVLDLALLGTVTHTLAAAAHLQWITHLVTICTPAPHGRNGHSERC